MSIVLYHHPFSRAATVLWMLEEVGVEHELRFVDILKGEQKQPEIVALNPMGKLPVLTDGDMVVTEVAAIGLYLADRYAAGRLAPAQDDPARGTYLRWSLFAPSVIEPGSMAKAGGWAFKSGQAGWGDHESMIRAMESAVGGRDRGVCRIHGRLWIASEELHAGHLTGDSFRQVQLTEKALAVYDVVGVRQRRRENLNIVAGLDLADRLVGGVAGLLGICAEAS